MCSKSNEINLEILKIFKESIPMFLVLSDEARQKIVMLLAENEEGLNVNRITENMELSRPAISHHLKVLKQAGVIDMDRKGTENYYFLTLKEGVDKMKTLIGLIEKNCILR